LSASISLNHLPQVLAVDAEARGVIVNAGVQHQPNDFVIVRVHDYSICWSRYPVLFGVVHPTRHIA
jgi:hypothetical protein